MKTHEEIIAKARAVAKKFVYKVESGRAISKETYKECNELLSMIDEYEKQELDLSEPKFWFINKYDVSIERMKVVEHKGFDVVHFIEEYLKDLKI